MESLEGVHSYLLKENHSMFVPTPRVHPENALMLKRGLDRSSDLG